MGEASLLIPAEIPSAGRGSYDWTPCTRGCKQSTDPSTELAFRQNWYLFFVIGHLDATSQTKYFLQQHFQNDVQVTECTSNRAVIASADSWWRKWLMLVKKGLLDQLWMNALDKSEEWFTDLLKIATLIFAAWW